MSTVILTCQQCGKTFQRPYAWAKRGIKYCSRECHAKARRKPVQIQCAYCNQSFTARPCEIEEGRKYCSWQCMVDDRKERITVTCRRCGKEFQTTKAIIARGGAKYCSYNCVKNTVTVSCQQCGKEFQTRRRLQQKGLGKYCSRQCMGLARRDPLARDQRHYHELLPKNWRKIAKQIRDRDNYQCTRCGKQGGDELNVHHIVPLILSQNSAPENLRTLCNSCHGLLEHQFVWLL